MGSGSAWLLTPAPPRRPPRHLLAPPCPSLGQKAQQRPSLGGWGVLAVSLSSGVLTQGKAGGGEGEGATGPLCGRGVLRSDFRPRPHRDVRVSRTPAGLQLGTTPPAGSRFLGLPFSSKAEEQSYKHTNCRFQGLPVHHHFPSTRVWRISHLAGDALGPPPPVSTTLGAPHRRNQHGLTARVAEQPLFSPAAAALGRGATRGSRVAGRAPTR